MCPIDILTGERAVEVTGVVGVSPALWYFRYIASLFLTLHKCLCSNKGNDQSSEIKSKVRQVLDYIITEVCNEVEIDNPSKTKEVSSPQVLL